MTYQDPDFGTVTLTVNPRAHSIIMRPQVDGLRVTVFNGANLSFVKDTINRFRKRLIAKQAMLKSQASDNATANIEAMRSEAKATLPQRVALLAQAHGFSYTSVTIRPSKTRWGSCSGHNSISLSLYLMRVPQHLRDYVILHELCHTVHHNHSDQFWQLMDKVTQGNAKSLRKELRQYNTL